MAMAEETIQLIDLDEELTKLWDQEQGQKKIKASLFNLILFVEKTEQGEGYQSLINSVVSKFPSRVLLILSDPNPKEEYLRTSVSSQTIGEGELQIFCEIIRIEVAGQLISRVPFIILPQILPDLPVYLLWTQDPAKENTILPHLEPLADRIIFDAGVSKDLQSYSKAIQSLSSRFHCKIGDLNWSACSGWRELLASLFDSQEGIISLAQTGTLRITYNKRLQDQNQHTEIEAAYLQAWIASRFDWKLESFDINDGNARITYKRPANRVVVLLIPKEEKELPAGSILSIEIESLVNEEHYHLKRHPTSRQVYIQHSNKECCDLPSCSYLLGTQEGQEIIEEMFYPSGGEHYQEMLTILSSTSWKLT